MKLPGIVRADARELPIADESIDLIVTSPPYWALRAYQDKGEYMVGQIGQEATPRHFLHQLWLVTREMVRVLKPTGSLFVVLGDKYGGSTGHNNSTLGTGKERDAPHRYLMNTGVRDKSLVGIPWRYALMCIDELNLILRAEIIWQKNGMPESVTDRVRRNHEQIFHFTKEGNYYANQMIKRPSVWRIPTDGLRVPSWVGEHFAAFPQELVRRIVLAYSPEGGRVLDPFGGTGTTAGVAYTLGREGISLDLSEDYCRMADWRTRSPRHFAKSNSRTWAEAQLPLL